MARTPGAPTPADHALAAELAGRAGALLLELRRSHEPGGDPAVLRKAGDHQSNELLLAGLAEAVPGDAVLSEESKDDPARIHASRVWIIDPLDGTREFGEPPRTDWAVHVALTIDGAPVAGAVALPALDVVLGTDPPATLAPPSGGPVRLVVSRTRPPKAATFLADRLGATLVEMGSAGAKAMAVIRGEVDVYVHSGGQYEWDSCAPVAVAAAAGCHCSRIDGSPLVYNNEDPYLPDLLICRPELAEPVLAALADFRD
ncbi:3'(2'),5'-bisphosphate nucleotidase CysQ [Rhabdothermincola sp.]|uniref:3'(2'),5'-bisphosphate nucleotidase CysQ n=1 Tax=Rhabdothermincola sp. TaxID=2820405 RepID=UPI002FE20EC3